MCLTCLLMVLCECACANLVSKANFNLIHITDLFICLHIMFQISFKNPKGQKSYCKFLGVRSELLTATKFYLKYHLGCGKAALCFGPDRIGTLVSMATDGFHRVIMGQISLALYRLYFLSNLFHTCR